MKAGIGGAAGEEEPVLLVDLGEVHGRRRLALLERPEALRRRRLADVHACPSTQPVDRRLPGGGDRMLRREPFLLQEAAGDGGDQRRVERGEARELDADLVTHVVASLAMRTPCSGRARWLAEQPLGEMTERGEAVIDGLALSEAVVRVQEWYAARARRGLVAGRIADENRVAESVALDQARRGSPTWTGRYCPSTRSPESSPRDPTSGRSARRSPPGNC